MNGRARAPNGDGADRRRDRPRHDLGPAGRRRARLAPRPGHGDGYQPPDAPLSRGLEVHPGGTGEDLEIWIDRRYVPAGYGWSFPAARRAAGRRRLLRPPLPRQGHDRAAGRGPRAAPDGYQGNWIPHKLRRATEGGVFFAGDSAGHCLPLTAEGIRTALYFGIALGRELRGVVEGRQSREQAAATYAEFNDSHEWKFRWMLRVQRLIPRVPPRLLGPAIRLMGAKRFIDWSFGALPATIAPPRVRRARRERRRAAQPAGGMIRSHRRWAKVSRNVSSVRRNA